MIGPQDILDFSGGSMPAFEKLYREYWNRVYQFTGLFVDNDFEREDIVQEVFVRLWKKRHLVDSSKEIDGLLFIITRNLVFNRLRKKGNMERIESVAEAAGVIYDSDTDSKLDASYLKDYVDKLISVLPERQREAFRLSRQEKLPIKQIALKMGISESGVKRHINLALKFIRANLPLLILFFQN
ncbi:MAG: RNA polymerase sigma-70 factor [Candidatus Cryptobacteroides sp.]